MSLNDLFAAELDANGIPYLREYRAIPNRKLAYDFCIPAYGKIPTLLLVELQGGTWVSHSGHTTGKAIQRDCEKVSLATLYKCAIMLFTTQDVEDGTAITMIKRYLEE